MFLRTVYPVNHTNEKNSGLPNELKWLPRNLTTICAD